MENVRLTVLSPDDIPVAHLDNSVPDAMHYYDELLHTYLDGGAYTFGFSTSARHEDADKLTVGNRIAFEYAGSGYSANIVSVEKTEYVIKVECLAMSLELTNEMIGSYKAPQAMSFTEYLSAFGFDSWMLNIGLNEVSDKKITNEWTGEATVLARLFSLANVFGAEIQFQPVLGNNGNLEKINLNIYRKHSDTCQGMGKDRSGEIFRYGQGIEGITKKSDISDLYTAIRPTGSDGLSLQGYSRTDRDSKGNVLYTVFQKDIRAPQARDRFPSNVMSKDKDQRYILHSWTCDVKDQATLYGRALAELKKHCEPKVEYTVDGYIDAGIGDTITIEDSEYQPALYLRCRVVEQEICFTDPGKNKTTFDNFSEMSAQISSGILDQMQKMIAEAKTYAVYLNTDNGLFLKEAGETTTITVSVFDGTNEITPDVTLEWYKDGSFLNNAGSYIVSFESLNHRNAVFKVNAKDKAGKIRGSAEVTITTIEIPEDGRTPYLHLRYSDDGGITFTANHGKTGGKYLGQYSDFSPIDSESPADYTWTLLKGADGIDGVNGADGKDGINGTNGSDAKQVKMVRTQFYLSDSDTELTGGSWDTACPSVPIGKYLWKRQRFVFTDNSVIDGNAWCEMSWAEYLQQQGQTLIDALNELDTRVHSELETGQATLHSAITTEYLNEIGEQIAVVRSQIEQNSSQLSLIFENVDTLTDSEKAHYAELQTVYTWFQFSSSGLTLGKVDDPVQLQLINNELRFLQDGTKVAWFSDSQLHVAEAVIENRLIVGNFEILSKNGGLMIRKFK